VVEFWCGVGDLMSGLLCGLGELDELVFEVDGCVYRKIIWLGS